MYRNKKKAVQFSLTETEQNLPFLNQMYPLYIHGPIPPHIPLPIAKQTRSKATTADFEFALIFYKVSVIKVNH